MLISNRHNFIFFANPKCASTTFEADWRRHSDLAITGTKCGKHFSPLQASKRLAFVFERIGRPPEAFFRFGIIRDPIDRAISWYNYSQRNLSVLPSKEKALHDFQVIIRRQAEQFKNKAAHKGPQAAFFCTPSGQLNVDYLIALPQLTDAIHQLKKALGIRGTSQKTAPKRRNRSPKLITSGDLDTSVKNLILTMSHHDLELYASALEGRFGSIENTVARKRSQLAESVPSNGAKG
jgi:hypothetical protein